MMPSSDSSSTDGALALPLSLNGLLGTSAVAHSVASRFAIASSLSPLRPEACFFAEAGACPSSSESPMLITLCSRLVPLVFGFEGDVKNASMDDCAPLVLAFRFLPFGGGVTCFCLLGGMVVEMSEKRSTRIQVTSSPAFHYDRDAPRDFVMGWVSL
jgi:hypothetical protein